MVETKCGCRRHFGFAVYCQATYCRRILPASFTADVTSKLDWGRGCGYPSAWKYLVVSLKRSEQLSQMALNVE